MADLLTPEYTVFPLVTVQATAKPRPETFARRIGQVQGSLGVELVHRGISDPATERELVRLQALPASLTPKGKQG